MFFEAAFLVKIYFIIIHLFKKAQLLVKDRTGEEACGVVLTKPTQVVKTAWGI